MVLAAHAAPVREPLGAPSRARRWSIRGLAASAWLLGLLAWPGTSSAAVPAPGFDDPAPHTSRNGAVQLSWPGPLGDYEVELEEPRSGPDGRTRVVYRGRMPSAHLSGLLEGDYSVRVRARERELWSPWSSAKVIHVRHLPLPMVYTLVALGLLTFLGTAVVVLRASREAT